MDNIIDNICMSNGIYGAHPCIPLIPISVSYLHPFDIKSIIYLAKN